MANVPGVWVHIPGSLGTTPTRPEPWAKFPLSALVGASQKRRKGKWLVEPVRRNCPLWCLALPLLGNKHRNRVPATLRLVLPTVWSLGRLYPFTRSPVMSTVVFTACSCAFGGRVATTTLQPKAQLKVHTRKTRLLQCKGGTIRLADIKVPPAPFVND